jgi:2-polyprenyl-3-methyl-5-hydroxy-6-metoxy-1,4-benzoquinol methylase
MQTTREPQYQVQFDTVQSNGLVSLGPTTSHLWRSDPKHLVFYLSRYKFVAKMLADRKRVLEVGCGDGFGSALVTQNGSHVHCTDFDPLFIDEAKLREGDNPLKSFQVVDFVQDKLSRKFDGIYALDVIEHIQPAEEDRFLSNIIQCLDENGILILGTPSLESQTYASVWSKAGHVNCKTGTEWVKTLSKYFHHTLIFGMNDEVVHTGFLPMSHYLFLVATGVKK